jgi:uncharacterized DUF497 family protein
MRIGPLFALNTSKKSSRQNIVLHATEAEQVLLNRPRIRFAEKGRTEGDDVYAAFGRTFEGRYLSIFFIYKPDVRTAIIISARDINLM